MRRTRTDPKSFDLTHPCPVCGYKIPPAEILHIDGTHICCPRCKSETEYPAQKSLGGRFRKGPSQLFLCCFHRPAYSIWS